MKRLDIFYKVFIFFFTISIIGCSDNDEEVRKCENSDPFSNVPGVVVAHSPKSTQIYLGSPSICILDNGDYIAACDLNSTLPPYDTTPDTWIFKSEDKGESWQQIATLTGQFWSQLFVHRNALYIMGTEKSGGVMLIRKSTDGGANWTEPTNETSGRLVAEGRYHCAPTPAVIHNGRLWKAMEDVMGGGSVWGQPFRAFMMSIPVEADLLEASNWTITNRLGYNPDYLGGDFGGWLEGNAVVAPDGQMVNILRTHYQINSDELASIIRISEDGKVATFNPETDFIDFPGGCKKFAIRREEQTGTYWSLSNYVPDSDKGHNTERTRNTLALIYSDNLRNWSIRGIVLYHPDIEKCGFQYVDFQFEDNDIIFVSRTAYEDGQGGADSQHNANFLTFHRIENYRNYQTPDLWKNLMP